MSLQDLKIKRIYRSKKDRLIEDLLAPALRRSTTYDRGTGYFSLNSLSLLADGLIPYIKKGGCIRIITSVDLSLEDRQIIQKGLTIQQSSVIEKINCDVQASLTSEIEGLKLDVITNLIAASRLIIKIAYMPFGGIYHEKFGLMKDEEGNGLCFIGSPNETYSGYNLNKESVAVIASWLGDAKDVEEQQSYFDDLWNNNVDYVAVFSFPEAVQKNLFKNYKRSSSLDESVCKLEDAFTQEFFDGGKEKELYKYQELAIEQFCSNGYSHFYEMATGTGKTFTAVKTVESLLSNTKSLAVMVLVPQIDLQAQWDKAFREVGISTLYFGGLASAAETDINFDNYIINGFASNTLVVGIATYDTFFSKLVSKVPSLQYNKMIIVDEAHNLSPNQIANLPSVFSYRLGLSATPERFNAKETEEIVEYFTRGTIDTFKYTIEEAIQNGYLSHYMYYPIFVYLSPEEFKSYQSYTKQLIYAQNEEPRDEKKIVDILNNRSVVVKKATNKLAVLEDLVRDKGYDFRNCVIYCGQGKDTVAEESIIDSVTKILAVDGHYAVSQFTSKTSNRVQVLSEFERGYYDVLAAIRCFDEGVDVPKLDKIYIMASDSLLRQTIQRRGRVLRKCIETGKTMAYIFDFVVLPPEGIYSGLGAQSLVENEMRRVLEYTRLADNQAHTMEELKAIYGHYDIELRGEENELDK